MKTIILFILNLIIWYQCWFLLTLQPSAHFLDIGQGDATLIQDHFTQIIIDTGPDEAILSQLNQFIPAYDKTIECLIITHPHEDHYQGLVHLLDYYTINQVVLPQIDDFSQTYQSLLTEIEQRHIPTIKSDNFTQISTNNLLIQFIFPFKYQIPEKINNLNDISNTMIIYLDNKKIAITGDLPQTIENQLVEKYGPNLDSDILQVGHHGSKTSSSDEFIDTVNPDLAIISAGKDNKFNHPDQPTLDRFKQNKIEVWRTDLNGTYSLKT